MQQRVGYFLIVVQDGLFSDVLIALLLVAAVLIAVLCGLVAVLLAPLIALLIAVLLLSTRRVVLKHGHSEAIADHDQHGQ